MSAVLSSHCTPAFKLQFKHYDQSKVLLKRNQIFFNLRKKLVFYGNTIGKSYVNEQKLLKVRSEKLRKKAKFVDFYA